MTGRQQRRLEKISRQVRSWRLHWHTEISEADLAAWVNPPVRGWMQYYGAFYRSALYQSESVPEPFSGVDDSPLCQLEPLCKSAVHWTPPDRRPSATPRIGEAWLAAPVRLCPSRLHHHCSVVSPSSVTLKGSWPPQLPPTRRPAQTRQALPQAQTGELGPAVSASSCGHGVLGESVSAVKLISIGLILTGVVGLNLSGVTPS